MLFIFLVIAIRLQKNNYDIINVKKTHKTCTVGMNLNCIKYLNKIKVNARSIRIIEVDGIQLLWHKVY